MRTDHTGRKRIAALHTRSPCKLNVVVQRSDFEQPDSRAVRRTYLNGIKASLRLDASTVSTYLFLRPLFSYRAVMLNRWHDNLEHYDASTRSFVPGAAHLSSHLSSVPRRLVSRTSNSIGQVPRRFKSSTQLVGIAFKWRTAIPPVVGADLVHSPGM